MPTGRVTHLAGRREGWRRGWGGTGYRDGHQGRRGFERGEGPAVYSLPPPPSTLPLLSPPSFSTTFLPHHSLLPLRLSPCSPSLSSLFMASPSPPLFLPRRPPPPLPCRFLQPLAGFERCEEDQVMVIVTGVWLLAGTLGIVRTFFGWVSFSAYYATCGGCPPSCEG